MITPRYVIVVPGGAADRHRGGGLSPLEINAFLPELARGRRCRVHSMDPESPAAAAGYAQAGPGRLALLTLPGAVPAGRELLRTDRVLA